MENNNVINGDIINLFGIILTYRYEITNQDIVPTYIYTSLLAYGWQKGARHYFKPHTILKNDEKRIMLLN